MRRAERRDAPRHLGLIALVCLTLLLARPSAQALTVQTGGQALRIHAPSLGFIQGEVLERLRDGRAVRLDFRLAILAKPAGAPVAEERQSFSLSYDLWEERFAVTRTGTATRSVSHLTATEAEAWCLENLAVPVIALKGLERDAPFWIVLAYDVQEPTAPPGGDDDSALTLRRLIDLLSRRPRGGGLGRSLEAGPFRLAY